jgi:hypothetical protein
MIPFIRRASTFFSHHMFPQARQYLSDGTVCHLCAFKSSDSGDLLQCKVVLKPEF